MKYLRYLGIALSLAGVVYFILAIMRSPESLIETAFKPSFVFATLGTMAVIFASLLLATLNWHLLLCAFKAKCPLAISGPVFLITQIGKYLPGNVGHLVGRAALLKSYGIPIRASSKAMLIEIAALLAVGTLIVATIFRDWLWESLAVIFTLQDRAAILTGISTAFVLIGLVLVRYRHEVSSFIRELCIDLMDSRRQLGVVALIDFSNFLLNGVALAIAARLLFPEHALGFFRCVGIAAAAFLAGYVTPGAPGGIGVREATTVFLLSSSTGSAEAAILSLVIRIGATLSDVVGFAVGGIALACARHRRRLSETPL